MNIFKTALPKIYTITMMILLFGVIAIHQGKILGYDLFSTEEKGTKAPTPFTIDDIKVLFTEATTFEIQNDSILVYNNKTQIGWGYNTSPTSDSIIGYTTSVPLLVAYDLSDKLVGLQLLKNYESPDFVEEIVKTGFMNQWNNLDIKDVAQVEIDAVSGATMTSTAIIQTLKHSTGKFLGETITLAGGSKLWKCVKIISGYILLLLALAQFFAPQWLKKYRTTYQVFVVGILGIWSGTFLSIFSFYNWSIHGIDIHAKTFVFIVLVFSIILPLATKKAFYCSHLCPFGTSQDLAGKLRKKKVKLPQQAKIFLSTLREKIFATIMLLLILGVSLDLTNVEPFSAFLFRTASVPVIVLAVTFIILSIFIPRSWCRYACPTGHLLEIIRKPVKK